MEINEKIPPPIQFTIHQYSGPFAWNGNHCFGVSLTKAAQVVMRLGKCRWRGLE